MKEIILIFTLIWFSNFVWGQIIEPEFLDYDAIITDLDVKGKKSKYYKKLDYETMMYLDKTIIYKLIKINPEFLSEHVSLDTSKLSHPIPEKHIYRFKVEIEDIYDFFNNRELFIEITDSLRHPSDRDLVYSLRHVIVKGTKKAIYTIQGNFWSDTYRISLNNNEIKIEWIYGIIE